MASWIYQLDQLNDTVVEYGDEFYRTRLQSLQAIDELVDGVISRLEQYGILDNTYIIYTSDNGFHIGQHRLQAGKTCATEEDINVPFYIRGPSTAAGRVIDVVTSHTDVVPTLFDLAGIKQRSEFDGTPIPVTDGAVAKAMSNRKRDHVGVEFWGVGLEEGKFAVRGNAAGGSKYQALDLPSGLDFADDAVQWHGQIIRTNLYASLGIRITCRTLSGARTSTSSTI